MAFFRGATQTTVTQTLTTVSRQTIVSSIKAQGKVTFANEQQLQFNQKGTVTKVNFKQGDHVKQGDVIAQLDDTTVRQDIRQAQLAVSASNLQLQQLEDDKNKQLQDATNSLTQAQQQAQQAQNNLVITQQKLPTDLAAAQRSVQEKQAALQQAQLNLDKQKSTEIQNLGATAQSVLTSSDQLLDSFYGVLTRGTLARPSQTTYSLDINQLLYNDMALKSKVENDYLTAANTADKMHAQYGPLVTQKDPTVLLQALSDAQTVAQAVYDLGEDTYSMLQGATPDTSIFTASDLNNMRSTVSANRSKAADLIGQVQTAEVNLAAVSSDGGVPSVTLKAAEDAVVSAQNVLTTAQDALKQMQTQNPASLQQQQQAAAQAQAQASAQQTTYQATSGDIDVQIALKKNSIAQQVTSLQKTEQSLTDTELIAPFDAVISHIDYQVGDNLLDTGNTEFMTLQNPGTIVVTIPLDQLDVVNVHVGIPATIAFDAVPGKTFQGAITKIDSTPIQQSGVVSYNVSIALPTPAGLNILSGMTATVTIETARKDNVLAVPNLAIRQTGSRTTVKKANGQSVPVVTGVTNGQYTEIVSGLNEGDSILSVNITSTASGQSSAGTNSAQQLFRLSGGGGGGGGFTGGGGVGGRPGG